MSAPQRLYAPKSFANQEVVEPRAESLSASKRSHLAPALEDGFARGRVGGLTFEVAADGSLAASVLGALAIVRGGAPRGSGRGRGEEGTWQTASIAWQSSTLQNDWSQLRVAGTGRTGHRLQYDWRQLRVAGTGRTGLGLQYDCKGSRNTDRRGAGGWSGCCIGVGRIAWQSLNAFRWWK